MTESKRRLFLVGSSVVFGLVVIYLWFFGWTTAFAVQAHWAGKKNPILYMVPVPLPDSSASNSHTKKFSISQFEFEVPWTEMEEANTKAPKNWLALKAPDGLGMVVIATEPDSLVQMLKGRGQLDSANLATIFEPEVLQSDYSLAEYMLETTPDRVRPLANRRRNADRLAMLTLKSAILPASANSGIFRIQTPEFRGFQYGDPAKGPRGIQVNLYSTDGKLEFIFSKKNGPVTITQPEINQVLQSLHKKAN